MKFDGSNVSRACQFSPYRYGCGPHFDLLLWDTGKRDGEGRTFLRYEFRMLGAGDSVLLFEGEDFNVSLCHAIDSDATVAALMSFLTLQPGDTDADYFEDYTAAQRAFCDKHAEDLWMEIERCYAEEGES